MIERRLAKKKHDAAVTSEVVGNGVVVDTPECYLYADELKQMASIIRDFSWRNIIQLPYKV